MATAQTALAKLQADNEALAGDLALTETKYNNLSAQYNTVNSENEQNKTEAERANAEVTKANEAVEGLELVSQQVEEATKNTATNDW